MAKAHTDTACWILWQEALLTVSLRIHMKQAYNVKQLLRSCRHQLQPHVTRCTASVHHLQDCSHGRG